MIHRDDDLTKLLHDLVQAGYSLGVNFEAGRVTALKMEFNHIFCIIETQPLVKSVIDGVVVIDREDVYNNMSQAMSALNSKLFLRSHLSHYTEKDLEVLDTYRAKPICGNLNSTAVRRDTLVEIDLTKAYTSAFREIFLQTQRRRGNLASKPLHREGLQPRARDAISQRLQQVRH